MLTNLPQDETVLFHPIVFFDQGTHFFETRRWLDGESLFRCGLAEPLNGLQKNQTNPTERPLVIDPIEPTRRLDADCRLTIQPPDAKPAGTKPNWECEIRYPAIPQGSWNLLAVLGPDEIERVRAAAGNLPPRPPDFGEEEWMLRHAFSDERVREDSFLAATLARLPILFARGYAGGIKFQSPANPSTSALLSPASRLVAVIDTGAY